MGRSPMVRRMRPGFIGTFAACAAVPALAAATVENRADDVQAVFNGYMAVSPTPLQPAATTG